MANGSATFVSGISWTLLGLLDPDGPVQQLDRRLNLSSDVPFLPPSISSPLSCPSTTTSPRPPRRTALAVPNNLAGSSVYSCTGSSRGSNSVPYLLVPGSSLRLSISHLGVIESHPLPRTSQRVGFAIFEPIVSDAQPLVPNRWVTTVDGRSPPDYKVSTQSPDQCAAKSLSGQAVLAGLRHRRRAYLLRVGLRFKLYKLWPALD